MFWRSMQADSGFTPPGDPDWITRQPWELTVWSKRQTEESLGVLSVNGNISTDAFPACQQSNLCGRCCTLTLLIWFLVHPSPFHMFYFLISISKLYSSTVLCPHLFLVETDYNEILSFNCQIRVQNLDLTIAASTSPVSMHLIRSWAIVSSRWSRNYTFVKTATIVHWQNKIIEFWFKDTCGSRWLICGCHNCY